MLLSLLYVCCSPLKHWRFTVGWSRKANPFGTSQVVPSLPRDTAAMPISHAEQLAADNDQVFARIRLLSPVLGCGGLILLPSEWSYERKQATAVSAAVRPRCRRIPPKRASKVLVALPRRLIASEAMVDCYKRVFIAVSELEASFYR
jgi:hypothetical protein